ncbi:hypothetical protein like AT4G21500 [Hibiscus trionum]|uniref:Transmembrane protein n=1 Tax=Hibiscus trionum TaxID=183268 RepID=A0A9W7MW38_HIBTR|nr:hypothetical protein like AT4G21500 [Hibiscus trionum]
MEEENCDGNGNRKEYLKWIEIAPMMFSSPTISNLSLISSNDPFFSCVITLYILILMYFPQSFCLKILFIFTASLLLSLRFNAVLRIRMETESERIVNEVEKTEFSQQELKWVGLKTDPEIIIRSFEDFFVESDVGAPLEVIFEGEEGEECSNEDHLDPTRVIERQPSLSLYYPESDSDSASSSEMDFTSIGEWISSEKAYYQWEEGDREEGMIEIDLDFHEDEDNLIEIDIS